MGKIKVILKNVVAILVLIALIAIIFYQNRDRDFLKFGKSESEKAEEEFGSAENITDGVSGRVIAKVGDKVISITSNTLELTEKDGKKETESIAVSNPVVHSDGEYFLCYGDEGKEITVKKGQKEYYKITTENRIIRAKVNRNGYSFVATEKEGYSSELTVYNRVGEAIFKWNLSESEFLDGDINSDNNKIVFTSVDAKENIMQGKLSLIDITNAQVEKEEVFESEIFYVVDFYRSGTYTALGSNKLVYFNSNGSKKWEYNYEGRNLLKADLTEPDNMVLAFSAAGSGVKGNSTEVEVINRLGSVIAKRNINSILDDIAVNKNKIALAFGKKLYITNERLKNKETLEADSSIKKVEFFADDNHLFVLGNSNVQIIS
ncbi:MAG: hypothetical protein IKA17_11070 [Clostridia bacterium]|nr:hypothetical protein [Clostridia bacterium]